MSFRFFSDNRATALLVGRVWLAAWVSASETLLAQSSDSTTSAAGRSVGSGVFTAEQAERGKQLHRANCTVCHDAVGYTGETFSQNWLDRSAFDFFDRLRTTMPNDNPGRLARDEYVDVVAYIFALNGYPSGGQELGPDDDVLKRVRIDLKPPGRKPAADTTSRVR